MNTRQETCPNPECRSNNPLAPKKILRKVGGDCPLTSVEYCTDPWHTRQETCQRCTCDAHPRETHPELHKPSCPWHALQPALPVPIPRQLNFEQRAEVEMIMSRSDDDLWDCVAELILARDEPADPPVPDEPSAEWINEDELPDRYPYDEMFTLSKLGPDGLGGVRIFPKVPDEPRSAEQFWPEWCNSLPVCDTTSTPRVARWDCKCGTYPDNLGPCLEFEESANGRCPYCDHGRDCHHRTYLIFGEAYAQPIHDQLASAERQIKDSEEVGAQFAKQFEQASERAEKAETALLSAQKEIAELYEQLDTLKENNGTP